MNRLLSLCLVLISVFTTPLVLGMESKEAAPAPAPTEAPGAKNALDVAVYNRLNAPVVIHRMKKGADAGSAGTKIEEEQQLDSSNNFTYTLPDSSEYFDITVGPLLAFAVDRKRGTGDVEIVVNDHSTSSGTAFPDFRVRDRGRLSTFDGETIWVHNIGKGRLNLAIHSASSPDTPIASYPIPTMRGGPFQQIYGEYFIVRTHSGQIDLIIRKEKNNTLTIALYAVPATATTAPAPAPAADVAPAAAPTAPELPPTLAALTQNVMTKPRGQLFKELEAVSADKSNRLFMMCKIFLSDDRFSPDIFAPLLSRLVNVHVRQGNSTDISEVVFGFLDGLFNYPLRPEAFEPNKLRAYLEEQERKLAPAAPEPAAAASPRRASRPLLPVSLSVIRKTLAQAIGAYPTPAAPPQGPIRVVALTPSQAALFALTKDAATKSREQLTRELGATNIIPVMQQPAWIAVAQATLDLGLRDDLVLFLSRLVALYARLGRHSEFGPRVEAMLDRMNAATDANVAQLKQDLETFLSTNHA